MKWDDNGLLSNNFCKFFLRVYQQIYLALRFSWRTGSQSPFKRRKHTKMVTFWSNILTAAALLLLDENIFILIISCHLRELKQFPLRPLTCLRVLAVYLPMCCTRHSPAPSGSLRGQSRDSHSTWERPWKPIAARSFTLHRKTWRRASAEPWEDFVQSKWVCFWFFSFNTCPPLLPPSPEGFRGLFIYISGSCPSNVCVFYWLRRNPSL